jgi:glutamate carboxypeptidase
MTDPTVARDAAAIAARAERELEALVGVSSPSGDVAGAEAAIAVCRELLPPGASSERVTSSTPGCAPDLVAGVGGRGVRRMLLLGHIDTVIGHHEHLPMRRDGERLYGPGTADMKGGVILSLGVARAIAAQPETFAELAILLVTDEEWRTDPFIHVERFAGYDACLCFEAGERAPGGEEGVVVRRKAAGTLRVRATGQAAHSGSAPEHGRNALLALAKAAQIVASQHDPHGPERLSAVPTVMHAGSAFNVVPAGGELTCDLRADRLEAFDPVAASIPDEVGGAALESRMLRRWPGMDATAATAPLLAGASARLGRPILGSPRGGASDAAHFAASIPLTVDGLGPRGGGAHTPREFVLASTLGERAAVALAIAREALGANLSTR